MPNIDFSRVNITIDQFQEVSRGKYNAGEIRLSGHHAIKKVNDHVHMTLGNGTEFSHAEVIAVKAAFVHALQEGGVNANALAEVRKTLGLAPRDDGTDTDLTNRNLKPLTRQQVRDILD